MCHGLGQLLLSPQPFAGYWRGCRPYYTGNICSIKGSPMHASSWLHHNTGEFSKFSTVNGAFCAAVILENQSPQYFTLRHITAGLAAATVKDKDFIAGSCEC